jgi:pimeloyl-[acyl-carrier protein] methyl ester esterase
MRSLVLLHGWGMTPRVFDTLSARLQSRYAVHTPVLMSDEQREPFTLESFVQRVSAAAPERCGVLGWSLGGQLALRWARAMPQQVEAVALIDTTPSFVQRDGWMHAVEPGVFQSFAEGLAGDREATLKRFTSLQAQGESHIKAAALALRECLASESQVSTPTLQRGLSLLVDTDLRNKLRDIDQDALVIHGECDRLVPIGAGEYLAKTLKRGRMKVIAGAAHAPFITQPAAVAQAVEEFFA